MMDLFTAIARRHSYRGGFLPGAVSRDDLARIVAAGIRAPSGCNAQSTSFVIVDAPARLAEIRAIIDKPVMHTAPALIVCVSDSSPVYEGICFDREDCAAAVGNMLLAVTALGYATVWLDGILRREGRAERIAGLLGVPGGKQVRVVLPIGRPQEACAQKEKKPFAERAWYNGYGLA